MGQKLYSQDETGIKFSSQRKPGEVRIPNYVYDIWLPILGSDALAVYAVYCRLEMKGAVKKIKLVDIARACRIGKGKLNKINDKLEDCGFVKINKPIGEARLMHWTTEVVVLDPPRKVSQELIDSYAPNYEILTPWLLGDEDQIDPPEDPNRTSGEPEQDPPEAPDKPPKIESLESLQPLGVEERETPSLRDQAQSGEMTTETELAMLAEWGRGGEAGVADPSQDIGQYIQFRDEVLQIFEDKGGDFGRGQKQREARRDAIIEFVNAQDDFDLDRWRNTLHTSIVTGNVQSGNLACFFAVYEAGGDYPEMCRQRKNGGSNARPTPRLDEQQQKISDALKARARTGNP